MPHFPPNNFFFGNPVPNFTVSNDRVLDNLRVRQPNTMMVPPATQVLIDPNSPSSLPTGDPPVWVGPLVGNNDPATNASLRSGVAQAGALVYSTTPIMNPLGPPAPVTGESDAAKVVDGCFDNRNHLYFSDGKNWIPLANCLENDGSCVGPQYAEAYSVYHNTDALVQGDWTIVALEDDDDTSSCFTVNEDNYAVVDERNRIVYTGAKEIVVKVTASASWRLTNGAQTDAVQAFLGIGLNELPTGAPASSRRQTGELSNENSIGSPPHSNPYPRNVTVSGIVTLSTDDYLDVRVQNSGSVDAIIFEYLNFSVVKLS